MRKVFLCIPLWLAGCLGEVAGPSGEGIPPHPIQGFWYSRLSAYGYPVERYNFYEYEYSADARLMVRFHDFHKDTLTGHLVLDSITGLSRRVTYSLDGDIVSENYFDMVSDTLVHIDRFRYTIAGDSLGLRACIILSGTGTGLEGRWETRLPSVSGPVREVVVFRDGMRLDSSVYMGRPPEVSEPRAYRVIDDSTFSQVNPLDGSLDTLGYRIRRDTLVILDDIFMAEMYRAMPAIP